MFGLFSKPKEKAPSKNGASRQRLKNDQLGIFGDLGVDPNSLGGANMSDEDSLEDELNALEGVKKPKPKPKNGGKKLVDPADLDRMVAESMKDIDEEEDDGDIDDEELEAELLGLDGGTDEEPESLEEATPAAPPRQNASVLFSTLSERSAMYQMAITSATASGEAARVKRLQRGLKTLQEMSEALKKGKPIDESEIPPPVATGQKRAEPPPVPPRTLPEVQDTPPAVETPVPVTRPPVPVETPQDQMAAPPVFAEAEELKQRRDGFKRAALTAKHAGDTETALKYVRIVKQFEPLIAAAENGQPVDMSSIPSLSDGIVTPIVSQETPALQLTPRVEETAQGTNNQKDAPAAIPTPKTALEALQQRLEKYIAVEQQAKDEGNSSKARRFGRIIKQYQTAIKDHKANRPVDYAELPCPPGYPPIPGVVLAPPAAAPEEEPEAPDSVEPPPVPAKPAPVAPEISTTPAAPSTIQEALVQRLQKYKSIEKEARDSGNERKAKMYGRIVKQYEDALKANKAGRQFDYAELPTPPGFPPIPGVSMPDEESNLPVPAAPSPHLSPNVKRQATAAPSPQPVATKRSAPTLQQKQMEILVERQKQFKQAAIDAKARGEVNQAKEFLKISKGFDPLIEASKGGLPVDMKTIPIPPQEQSALDAAVGKDFVKVSVEECTPPVEYSVDSVPDMKEVYRQLEIDFLTQMKACLQNRDHFRASGDAASANRMEQLAQDAKRDLDRLRVYKLRGDPVPRYKYETKTFSIVRCNTELDDNVIEIHIIRGINYIVPNPREVDTYVKFEFPWPSETPVKHKTTLVKDTNNPEYNQAFIIPINRQSRSFQRVLKKTIKFEVFSKGGFFSGDKEVGRGGLKIQDLETKCEVHEIVDILDGRKPVGKLEAKAKVRHPILTKQVETVNQKWITLVD